MIKYGISNARKYFKASWITFKPFANCYGVYISIYGLTAWLYYNKNEHEEVEIIGRPF